MSKPPQVAGLPYLVPIPDVATALGWSSTTIRRHIMPIEEWASLSAEERRGRVPVQWVGEHARIPRWWLEDIVRQSEEARASAQEGR